MCVVISYLVCVVISYLVSKSNCGFLDYRPPRHFSVRMGSSKSFGLARVGAVRIS